MATTIEKIQQLIQELGPNMQDIDAIVQTEEPSWAIQFSDETIIIIEAVEEPARMVFSAELGNASETNQRAIYEALLCYNLMWRDTGGVKIGLAGPQGALIISTELCLEGLMLNDLQNSLTNFLKITRSWQGFVHQASPTSATMPGMEGGSFTMHA
jgi:Tir chaperone protein (CesT) family